MSLSLKSSGGLGSNELHDSSIVPAFALLLNMPAQFFMTVYPTCTFPVSYRQCKRGQCVSFFHVISYPDLTLFYTWPWEIWVRDYFPCFSYEEALVKASLVTLSGRRQILTDNIFKKILENKDSKLRKLLPPQNTKCHNLGKSRKFNPSFKTERFRKSAKRV